MTTHADMLFHLGGLPVMMGIPFSANSKYYFIDPTSGVGSDGNSGLSPDKPLATLVAAEAKMVAGQHDCALLIGNSSITHTEAITWDKNYCHIIGISAPTMVAQRSRMFQASDLTSASPLLDIQAQGCIFKNFYQFQGVADSGSLINVEVSGGRNYFENVHFAGAGHTDHSINGCSSLKLNGGYENTFVGCTIGVDTALLATGGMAMVVDSEATRNIFKKCNFIIHAGHISAGFVELMDNESLDRYMIFEDCLFINTNGPNYSVDDVFTLPANFQPPRGPIILRNTFAYGADDWDGDDRGVVVHDGGTRTTGGNSGIMLASTAS